MLIIKMIMRITNFTQQQLADFLNVSRVTVNYWLKGENISLESKKTICEKFNIPLSYFDISLEENIEIYKIIYATINNNWHTLNIKEIDKIDEILNEVESDSKTNIIKVSENDIINGLVYGYNPFTGEMFEENHILNNQEVKKLLTEIKNKYYKFEQKNIEKEDLNKEQKELFNKFKKWRKEKMEEEGFFSAYMIFNNQELINIIYNEIYKKKDLLGIKGIGLKKYEKYGDDIFDILKVS